MTNEERDEAIREIWGVVREIQITVTKIATTCPNCQEAIKRHEISLDGNGAGLKVRVAGLEMNVRWIWAAIGGLVTCVGMIGLSMFQRFLEVVK